MLISVLVFNMATQFYLTLPSNSSLAYFPNNTLANFRVNTPYQTVVLKETQYSSIDQLTKPLNAGLSKEIQTKVKFNYNHSSRKVLVDLKHGTTVWFTGELATVLGFDQDTLIEKKTSSPYASDINGGFSSM